MTLALAPAPQTHSDQTLLSYNQRGALAHLLAVEEHLQQLPPGVDMSWCAKKHSILAVDHHLSEAVNHASRIDPAKAAVFRRLKLRAEKVLKPATGTHLPNLGAVAKLRNDLRAAFNDPTLKGNCPVCTKDQNMAGLGMHQLHPMHPYRNGVPAMYGLGEEPVASWKPIAILAGLGVMAYFFLGRR